jgi:ferredoxin-type protein NapG
LTLRLRTPRIAAVKEDTTGGGDGAAGGAGSGSGGKKDLPRRDFFREGLRHLLRPLAEIVEDRLSRLQVPQGGLGGGRAVRREADGEPRLLRPPGALKEELFVERCERTGRCITVCPVQAIRPLEAADARSHGTPYIEPQLQACVVCDGLHCLHACPSGALSVVPRHLIEMGLAEVRQETCLRSMGEDCRICVEKCPIGKSALLIEGGRVEVKSAGCVGCGVCEMVCPTTPRAIVVRPR